MLLRYRMERRMEAPSPDALFDEVRWHDELFTYNGIPTERLNDVYLEAMSHHGDFPLKANDYVNAWHRIKPKEGDGADTRPMSERGSECATCRGEGKITKFVPTSLKTMEGYEVEVECPFGCNPITTISVRH